jgi:hypothetical protein
MPRRLADKPGEGGTCMVLILFLMSVALLSWVVGKDSPIAKDLPLKEPPADGPVASPGVWQLARAIEERAGSRPAKERSAREESANVETPRAGQIR